jgi:hypothetical protein
VSISFAGYIDPQNAGPSKAKAIDIDYEHPLFLNLNEGNASALLGLLRLEKFCYGGCGSCTIPQARQAIMYARATFGRRAEGFTRPAAEGRGQMGARFVVQAFDATEIHTRLERFARLVEFLAEKGATHVCWA